MRIFILVFLFIDCSADSGEISSILEEAFELPFRQFDRNNNRRVYETQDDERDLKQAVDVLGKATSLLGGLVASEGGGLPIPINFFASSPRNPLKNSDDGKKSKTMGGIFDSLSQIPMKLNNLQGPHICVKEVNVDTIDGEGFEMSMSCNRYRDAAVCSSKSPTGKVTRRIQDCCDGYTTDDIAQFGCEKEITEELLYSFNVSSSDVPQDSTLLFTKPEEKSYLLQGIQNIYEWEDKQVLRTQNNEKFVVKVTQDFLTEIYLNCAVKKETIKTKNSEILRFEGNLKSAADNLLEIIETNPNLSIFFKLLGDELQTFLKEINSATVFAFTNEAFEKLPESTKKQLLNENRDECVQEIMKQHISTAGSYCSSTLPLQIRSQNGNTLSVQKNPLKIDEARIIDSSGFALNGVVHIIDAVLVRENFLSWKDTLRNFNPELADELERENIEAPLTVFIPPSDNTTEITNVKNYVVSNRLLSAFKHQTTLKTDAGSEIFTGANSEDRSKFFSLRIGMNDFHSSQQGQIGCTRFTAQPIYSCKAVLHFIDKPLPVVNQTVDEFLESREDLSIFYSLWKELNTTSVEPLTRITLFVPHNDAFSPNFLKKIRKSQKSINSFVKRHIVRSILCSFDIEKNPNEVRSTMYTSIGGDILSPTSDDDVVGINDAKVQESEIILSDGVVHILDSAIERSKRKNSKNPTGQIIKSPLSLLSHIFG